MQSRELDEYEYEIWRNYETETYDMSGSGLWPKIWQPTKLRRHSYMSVLAGLPALFSLIQRYRSYIYLADKDDIMPQ